MLSGWMAIEQLNRDELLNLVYQYNDYIEEIEEETARSIENTGLTLMLPINIAEFYDTLKTKGFRKEEA